VTASSDGVSVEKSFEPDDFPVPAIAFVVRSEREETVSVRLVDTVPSHVPPEDIGFHPKYGAEFWGVESDTIVFERDFEPGEEYTTVYGLRGGDADDVEKFMTEPELEDVDPPLDETDAGQTVRDVIGDADAVEMEDDADAVDAASPDDAGSDDDVASAVEQVDAGEPVDGDGPPDDVETAEVGDEAGDPDEAPEETIDLPDANAAAAAGAAASRPGDESLVTALASEIRSGAVADEDVAALRNALGVDLASASVEARVEHLQSAVSDLEAYTEALEEFLDENGDAQRLISEVQADFEAATERFDDLEAKADAAAEAAESVDDRLDEEFEDLQTRLENELAEVDDRVETALADVEAAADDVDEAVEERVEAELDELWAAVDEASSDADDAADEVAALREEVGEETDERLAALEADVAELSDELADVAEMRDRLANALGGVAPAAGDVDDGNDADDAADEE